MSLTAAVQNIFTATPQREQKLDQYFSFYSTLLHILQVVSNLALNRLNREQTVLAEVLSCGQISQPDGRISSVNIVIDKKLQDLQLSL